MKIYENLKINIEKKQALSFVGAGGKTTTIFQLAKELIREDKKVLISTTTKIFNPKNEYSYYFLKDIDRDFYPLEGTITILGQDVKDKKLIGVCPEKIDHIVASSIFDILLIEADGAKRKPIKAPDSHEPKIPLKSTKTIGIVGLDCLNKPIDKNIVHRPKLLKEIKGNENLNVIDEDLIINLVLGKHGLFKGSRGDRVLILNKANEITRIQTGKDIRKRLKAKGFENVLLGDIKKKEFY